VIEAILSGLALIVIGVLFGVGLAAYYWRPLMAPYAVEFVDLVNSLRGPEGNSVTILSDNADFHGPNVAVDVCGEWTDWQERRFEGDNLLACLREAEATMLKKNERTPFS